MGKPVVVCFISKESYEINNASMDFMKLSPVFLIKLFFATNSRLVRELKVTDILECPHECTVTGRFYHVGKSVGLPYRVFTGHLKGSVQSNVVGIHLDPDRKVNVPEELAGGEYMRFNKLSIECHQIMMGKTIVTIDVVVEIPCKLPSALEKLPRVLLKKASKKFVNTLKMTSV
jgi:hypothetical protein